MSKISVNKDHYLKDGKKYDRVSNFTGFTVFKTMIPAMERGTIIHGYCDMFNTRKLKPKVLDTLRDFNLDVYNVVDQYIKWFMENVEEIHFSEKTMFDEKLMVGGTADLLVTLKNGERHLIDIKSGKPGPHYFLQLGQYFKMASQLGYKPTHAGLLFVSSTGCEYVVAKRSSLTMGRSAWLNYLGYARILESLKNC